MKTTLPALALASLLWACAAAPQPSASNAAPDNRAALAGLTEMKIAFDITEGNPKALLGKLGVIDTTRKQLIEDGVTPRMVLAFRGDASYFTQADVEKLKPEDREDARKIAAKLKELRAANGVEALEQCNLPLAPRKLRSGDVMPEVKVVGNGWISLVAYQRRGYAYIAP
jgi:intracellular sulfur oxidation DsrE/DsrF family protein